MKKYLGLILLCLLLCVAGCTDSAETGGDNLGTESESTVQSQDTDSENPDGIGGSCGAEGDNVKWSFEPETGKLTISGKGEMEDYNAVEDALAPLHGYADSIKTVIIDNGVTSIGDWAFYDCSSLASITIPDSVMSIGSGAFNGCRGLQNTVDDLIYIRTTDNPYFYLLDTTSTAIASCTINSNTRFIGNDAFSNCSSLTSVTIPDSVTSIGDWAFFGCNSLTSVTIGSGVTSISIAAFPVYMASITVDENNTKYSSDAYGVLFNKDKTTLIQYPIGNARTEYTIPDSVTSIGVDAFMDCSSLTSITIPDSVTSIGDWAFSDCRSLTTVTIPDSVTSIGGSAFSGCSSLTTVTISDSVTSIGDWAFFDCTNLTIYASAGNYAETFARQNGIPFSATN